MNKGVYLAASSCWRAAYCDVLIWQIFLIELFSLISYESSNIYSVQMCDSFSSPLYIASSYAEINEKFSLQTQLSMPMAILCSSVVNDVYVTCLKKQKKQLYMQL